MTSPEPMSPITEDDIADYLVNTPDFFERHASLLATVQLTHPQSHRAVGLQERQAQMLRDKIKALEHRIMDMIRHGNENMILTDKLHRWSCELLVTPQDQLAESALDNIRELFQVPQVALRLWSLQGEHAQAAYAQGVTEAVQTLACFWLAGAGLARCPAFQQPDGHRPFGAPGRVGRCRFVGPAKAAGLSHVG
jgi:uncharacterized protein YigA (DUF484 family)